MYWTSSGMTFWLWLTMTIHLLGSMMFDGHRSSFRGIRFSGWMTLCHGDQGRGRFVHANGDVYEGQWLDDKARPTASKG